jgi:hypothetical protein
MRSGADSLFAYPNPAEIVGLAKRARFHGMRLETVAAGDRVDHFVFEPKTGRRQYVTALSCDCRQFIGSGGAGCQHLALVQVETNWIPEAVAAVEMEIAR